NVLTSSCNCMTPPLKERHCTSLRKTGAELDQASREGKTYKHWSNLNKYREKAKKTDFLRFFSAPWMSVHMNIRLGN
ncbi:MAG: hypothetical protein ACRAUW_17510, partial [Aeromonas sp.]|uniref:hypothetical protein n=1 Tax=Aeromonas sp. TaxID=647 RepID=UPI003D6BB9A4